MGHSLDLRCERCGGQDIGHFIGRDARRREVWRNRCGGCGLESEYMPTQSEIRQACLRIRCAGQLPDGGDPWEKFRWRAEASVGGEDPRSAA